MDVEGASDELNRFTPAELSLLPRPRGCAETGFEHVLVRHESSS
jgi:hypothetical protein